MNTSSPYFNPDIPRITKLAQSIFFDLLGNPTYGGSINDHLISLIDQVLGSDTVKDSSWVETIIKKPTSAQSKIDTLALTEAIIQEAIQYGHTIHPDRITALNDAVIQAIENDPTHPSHKEALEIFDALITSIRKQVNLVTTN